MAWTAPRTWTTGELVTKSIMDTHVRDNLTELRAGGIAISSQAANEVIFASSSSQFSRSSSFTYNGTTLTVGALTLATTPLGVASGGTGLSSLTANRIPFGNGTSAFQSSASFTYNGTTFSVGTASTHTFTAGSSTSNRLDVINTTSGTTALATLRVTGGSTFCGIDAYSQGYTTGTVDIQASVLIQASGAGGMSFYTTAGPIRIFPGGTTEKIRVAPTTGTLLMGTATDIAGFQQVVYAQPQIALGDSGVAHGMTSLVATDVLGILGYISASAGGAKLWGFTEATQAIYCAAYSTTEDTAKNSAAVANFLVDAAKKSGTGIAALGANANIAAFQTSGTTRFILDSDGDSHQDVGTAWTNFDDFDDVALLTALSVGVSRDGDALRQAFSRLLEEQRPALERARIVTFNDDGHHFVNMSRLQMLTIGAVRQLARELTETKAELKRLQAA